MTVCSSRPGMSRADVEVAVDRRPSPPAASRHAAPRSARPPACCRRQTTRYSWPHSRQNASGSRIFSGSPGTLDLVLLVICRASSGSSVTYTVSPLDRNWCSRNANSGRPVSGCRARDPARSVRPDGLLALGRIGAGLRGQRRAACVTVDRRAPDSRPSPLAVRARTSSRSSGERVAGQRPRSPPAAGRGATVTLAESPGRDGRAAVAGRGSRRSHAPAHRGAEDLGRDLGDDPALVVADVPSVAMVAEVPTH